MTLARNVTIDNASVDVSFPDASALGIKFADSPAIDAFGRLRVSQPTTLFSSAHQYNDSPIFWQTKTTGSGSATHLPNESAVRLRVAGDGDSVIRQTYKYFRYLPGKSQLILLTGVITAGATGVTKRAGYFDGSNGIFFQQVGDTMSVGLRSNVTGSPVDTIIDQPNWNLDTMDGNGPSGITLDLEQSQILAFDLEWLGVGRVRFGFVIDGLFYYVHEYLNANNNPTVYMTTANLPVRYEISQTGGVAANSDLIQICSSVASEGGSDDEVVTRLRSVNMGETSTSVTTRRSVLTIRPKATFNGLVNRGQITPIDITVLNQGNQDVLIELVRNGALGGSPSFSSAGASSLVEYDVLGTTVTGGEIVWSGYIYGGVGASNVSIPLGDNLNSDIPLTLDIDGLNPTNFSIILTSLGNATACFASATWREVY